MKVMIGSGGVGGHVRIGVATKEFDVTEKAEYLGKGHNSLGLYSNGASVTSQVTMMLLLELLYLFVLLIFLVLKLYSLLPLNLRDVLTMRFDNAVVVFVICITNNLNVQVLFVVVFHSQW